MVSRRSGYQTACTFLVGQGADLVIRSAHLIRTGPLKVFRLEENLVPGYLAEMRAFDKTRLLGDLANLRAGILECVDGEHAYLPRFVLDYKNRL